MFTKTQLLQSEKYREYRDVLMVLLEENKTYSHKDVQREISKFSRRPVVEKTNPKGV